MSKLKFVRQSRFCLEEVGGQIILDSDIMKMYG